MNKTIWIDKSRFCITPSGQILDISHPNKVKGVCKYLKKACKGQLLFMPYNPRSGNFKLQSSVLIIIHSFYLVFHNCCFVFFAFLYFNFPWVLVVIDVVKKVVFYLDPKGYNAHDLDLE